MAFLSPEASQVAQTTIPAAAVWERGGQVLNDHYTKDQYVNRRVHFLSRLPDFAGVSAGLSMIAARDCAIVFRSEIEPAISVQRVRHLELQNLLDPLTPLPTTENTETIDSFRSYPADVWRAGMPELARSPPQASASEGERSPRPGLAASLSRSKTSQQRARGCLKQRANRAQTLVAGQQTAVRSSSLPIPENSVFATNMAPSSPMHAAKASVGEYEQFRAMSHEDKAAKIVELLKRPIPLPTSRNVHTSKQASALAGRGMSVPVKYKRGTKRRASEPAESPESQRAVNSVFGAQATVEPPKKRIRFKLHGPRDASQATSPEVEVQPEAEKSTSRKQRAAPAAKQPRTIAAKQPRSAPATKQPRTLAAKQPRNAPIKRQSNAQSHLEAVIAGTALPATKAQATRAANLRHDSLLAAHKEANPQRTAPAIPSKGARRSARSPDFPPEFFNRANFPPDEREDTVRCVCGVTIDDGKLMICCDGCGVWQHHGCMGAAVPEDLVEGRYQCQVCDVWGHRVLVARLRRGE
ncbi:hypothetical protein LTR62_001456 [Meristemomyces frigidus]|uniref:Zinc finger PHD-type domain-containing protein n=1 Tax=Meristemomyces frigidus TaxID=1508187 RepID=A0AAN7TGH3_9PEZI|nr:hypothetical protein LTR62_001456 [Meristemomyces frigidus]